METTINEIQIAIKEIDNLRLSKGLSSEEIEILELSAVAMRDAERLAISRLHKQIISEMENKTSELNLLAKQIRSKVTEMNKIPKNIDNIEKVIKMVYGILRATERWI